MTIEHRRQRHRLPWLMAAAVVFLTGTPSVWAQSSKRVLCRWGPKSKMDPVPRCGVPRTVEVSVPRGIYRLYFARGDNPGLSGYFFRGRNAQARPREFKNKVNLVSVVLMLCPADFKNEKLLAFRIVDRKNILKGRPTCRLGPPTAADDKGKLGAEKSPDDDPGKGGDGGDGGDDDVGGDGDDVEAPDKTVSQAVTPPKGKKGVASWKKIDRYARLLAMVGLALGLLCLASLIVLSTLFYKKLRALAAETRRSGAGSQGKRQAVIVEPLSQLEEEPLALGDVSSTAGGEERSAGDDARHPKSQDDEGDGGDGSEGPEPDDEGPEARQ